MNFGFFKNAAAALALSILALGAAAAPGAGKYEEGKDYKKIPEQVRPGIPDGKRQLVTVIFWYGCPHCWELEKRLPEWEAKNPLVEVRNYPAVTGGRQDHLAKAHFANEIAGDAGSAMHRKIFSEIFENKKNLADPSAMAKFMESYKGAEYAQKFVQAFNSFGMSAKMAEGRKTTDALRLEGTPTILVDGKWMLTPTEAGLDDLFSRIDYLLAMDRSAAKDGAKARK